MENAQTACIDGSCRLKGVNPPASCLTANQLDLFIFNKVIETADSVGAAAHAGHDHIGQTAFLLQHLTLDFLGNHRLEIPDNGRERMRAHYRA